MVGQHSNTAHPVQLDKVSSDRRELVDRARQKWIKSLTDTSRRNNLLYFRALKTGSLDLSDAPLDVIQALLNGDAVSISALVPAVDDVVLNARARVIARRAKANLEERGIATLHIGLGCATWRSADGGKNPEAVVLLVPVTLESRKRNWQSTMVSRSGDIRANLVLLQVLQDEWGCTIPEDQIFQNIDVESAFDPKIVFDRLVERCVNVKGFSIKPKHVLSNFAFQKMAMVQDLRLYADQMGEHDLIAAVAGDKSTRLLLAKERVEIDVDEIDKTPPDNEYLVVDSDSSQQRVIFAASQLQDGVIQGPPGTGKSQTIVNLIASLAANGARVLFVAEKRAALEVVKHRLSRIGLDHLVLDLHGADVSRRDILTKIGESLATIRETPRIDASETHRKLVDRRQKLNDHVAWLHMSRDPAKQSIYDLRGRLLRTDTSAQSVTRLTGKALAELTPDRIAQVKDLLDEAASMGNLLIGDDASPWARARIDDEQSAQTAIDAATELSQYILPTLLPLLEQLSSTTGLPVPTNAIHVHETMQLQTTAEQVLEIYHPDIQKHDLEQLADELKPARSGLKSLWASLTNSGYREALKTAQQLRRQPTNSKAMLLAEIRSAAELLQKWREKAGAFAQLQRAEQTATASDLVVHLQQSLRALAHSFPNTKLDQLVLADLQEWVTKLTSNQGVAYQLPRIHKIRNELEVAGLGPFIAELRQAKVLPKLWSARFEYVWVNSCHSQALIQAPALASFSGNYHSELVNEFRKLDQTRINLAIARVRRTHAENAIAAMNAHLDQKQLVQRETEKKSRHLPFRTLLSKAPDVLTAIFPCWMASPLSVSQLLDGTRRYFDVVIFDEASQVLPEDAIPAMLRADHAIVAGDKHQLPPTTFFAGGDDNEEAEDDENSDGTQGYESLLDLMASFLDPWMLEWHYRSKDEALIAFSNRYIYQNRLVTFPGANSGQSISHVLVDTPIHRDSDEDSASAEVLKVVELILDHARQRPHETLGVIALGIAHAQRLQAALDDALERHPELDSFFGDQSTEPFFIKNLERVQGDERDAIILSVGYGKDHNGKLPYRFGPLLSDGGERRLNVAVTRARRRMTLVSSFDHMDMDPGRSKARGVELLRLYLQFAASQGRNLGESQNSNIAMNPFEADIYDALTSRGMKLLPQWGASRYRLDFAVQHPDRPGQFVLAIECDGASYHSAPTARDRDRLRQQQLEAIGWRFHRIWSTDWFLRREEEIERALSAYQSILNAPVGSTVRLQETSGPNVLMKTAPSIQDVHVAATKRHTRPTLERRSNITDYRLQELVDMIRWIVSDGKLRADDEILAEVVQELGFKRRGARIDAAITQALEHMRKSVSSGNGKIR